MISVASIDAVNAQSIEIVTSRGNVFVVDLNKSDGTSNDTGISMIDGLGINARLIYHESGGKTTYGISPLGIQESLKPYVKIPANTKYAFTLLDGVNATVIVIPHFDGSFSYDSGKLAQIIDTTNILGYTDSRRMTGDISVYEQNGIVINGAGRMILEIANYTSQTLLFLGNISDGTSIRYAESPYDLLSLSYYPGRGFLVHFCQCDPGPDSLEVPVGTVTDSSKSGIFGYTQRASATWYYGRCCSNSFDTSVTNYVGRSADLIQQSVNGQLLIVGDNNDLQQYSIEKMRRPGAHLLRVLSNNATNPSHYVFDTLPVHQIHSTLSGSVLQEFAMGTTAKTSRGIYFTGLFPDLEKSKTEFLPAKTYLVIDSAGGRSDIRAHLVDTDNFLAIKGLPPGVGYEIKQNGKTAVVGITDDAGKISLTNTDAIDSTISASLYLYEHTPTLHISDIKCSKADTRTCNARLGTVVFDTINNELIRLESAPFGSKLYNVHAYVKIPVTGDVQISALNLDGSLHLDYLTGDYTGADTLLVPVIPTFKKINLVINGVPATLSISDVLGAIGLKIADPVSNTITISDNDGFVDSIESTVGVTTYIIAPNDGNAKAHVRATVSGTSEITNTRTFYTPPPPPPPPRPRDPLTTWIEVYVNGELQTINGQSKTQIFFNDSPSTDHQHFRKNTATTHIARFSYMPFTVTDTISVPAKSGDFVEFYFYNKIYAEGSQPPLPTRAIEVSRNGEATATAVLKYASINTSM